MHESPRSLALSIRGASTVVYFAFFDRDPLIRMPSLSLERRDIDVLLLVYGRDVLVVDRFFDFLSSSARAAFEEDLLWSPVPCYLDGS